jgi:drug/metabolite transporter (DMT)-like permease
MPAVENRAKAIGHALTSAFGFAVMGVFVKLASEVGFAEKVLFRNLVTLAVAFVVVQLNRGRLLGRRENQRFLLARALLGIGGVMCYFWAIDHLVLADAAMLGKLSPFFVAIFAAAFIGERLDRRVVFALVLGFTGGLLVIKPRFELEVLPSLVGAASAVFAGGAYVLLRFLREREKPETIVFYFSLVTVVGLLPFVAPSFVPPSPTEWLWLLGIGTSAAVGQISLTAAYRYGRAGPVSLISYTTILFAAFFGWLIWAEVPDFLSIIGGILIIAGATAAFVAGPGQRKDEVLRSAGPPGAVSQ